MMIFRYISTFVFIVISVQAFGQVDAPRKSIVIGGTQTNELQKSVLVSPENAEKTISSGTLTIKSKMTLSRPEDVGKPKEVRFGQGDEFAKKDFTALANKLEEKFAKKDNPLRPEFLEDQFLGDFKSGSKFVKFVYRDHEFVDGDRVSVAINGVTVHPNILLTGSYQGFYMDLEQGFNRIEITALNQGTSGPNTAQFIILDDNKQVISSNIWNLATGVKASVVIVKD